MGNYGIPVEDRPGFTNQEMLFAKKDGVEVLDEKGNPISMFIVEKNDGINRWVGNMVVCQDPQITIQEFWRLFDVSGIPKGVHDYSRHYSHPDKLKSAMLCVATGAPDEGMDIIKHDYGWQNAPLPGHFAGGAYPLPEATKKYIYDQMFEIMRDIVEDQGITWEVDRGEGLEAAFFSKTRSISYRNTILSHIPPPSGTCATRHWRKPTI